MNLATLSNNNLLAPQIDPHTVLDQQAESDTPLIAKILLGIGGWLTAIFTIPLFGLIFGDILFRHDVERLAIVGIVVTALAVWVSRYRQTFVDQLTLAFGISGLVMISIGLWDLTDHDGLISWLALLVAVPLVYVFSKNTVLRFSSILVLSTTLILDLYDRNFSPLMGLLFHLGVLLVLASGLLKTNFWRPALLASIFGYFGFLFIHMLAHLEIGYHQQPSALESWLNIASICLGFPAIIYALTKPKSGKAIGFLVLLAAVFFGLSYFGGEGIAAAIGLLVIAKARNDRLLTGVALLALTVFVIAYYYFLGVPLLHKAYIMLGSGGALVALSIASRRIKTPINSQS